MWFDHLELVPAPDPSGEVKVRRRNMHFELFRITEKQVILHGDGSPLASWLWPSSRNCKREKSTIAPSKWEAMR
jgi:hypothetical protein